MPLDAPRHQVPVSAGEVLLAWVAQRERDMRHVWRLRKEMSRLQAGLAAGKHPVVVYSPQKTGSTAVATALERHPDVVLSKVHTLLPEHYWDGDLRRRVHEDGSILIGSHYTEAARRVFMVPRRAAQFVVTLREPVATNLSWFAFAAHRAWLRDKRRQLATLDGQHLAELFLERFPHQATAVWPTVEMGAALGFDPYSEPFPQERGWQRVKSGPWDVLILRADLPDAAKAEALQQFTGLRGLEVKRARESGEGVDGIYARLKSAMHAHPEYVARMLDTRFATHYWSAEQRAAIAQRWAAPR